MTNRTPPVWMALVASVMVVAFSVTNAMGADPVDAGTNRGQQTSDFVHMLLFGEDVPPDVEGADETGDESTADDFSPRTHPENHGSCVRDVATVEVTGGPQDNRGGAVNEAARVTCRESKGGDGATDGDSAAPQHGNAGSTLGGNGKGNSGNAHEKNENRKGGSGGG